MIPDDQKICAHCTKERASLWKKAALIAVAVIAASKPVFEAGKKAAQVLGKAKT